MRKALYYLIIVFAIILLSKTTFVQVGKSIRQPEVAQVNTPMLSNTLPDSFDPDETIIDFTDDNLNDSEIKNPYLQNIAFSTGCLVAFAGYDQFAIGTKVSCNDLTFPIPLYLLNSVFII